MGNQLSKQAADVPLEATLPVLQGVPRPTSLLELTAVVTHCLLLRSSRNDPLGR